MPRTSVLPVTIRFGDCDPAGIVFYPNFLRWMDAASLHFFATFGVPPWRDLERTHGITGTPLLEVQVKFMHPATYPEDIAIHTHVAEWHPKVFVHHHQLRRGDEVICVGRETRAFVTRDPARGGRMRAIPIPPDIRARCE
jgi:4-hydroxybenzoyl-CoA thioesterase